MTATHVADGAALLRLLSDYRPAPTDYFVHGADRIAASLNMVPKGTGQVLELGCDSHFTLAMSLLSDYTMVPQNLGSPIASAEHLIEEPVFTHATGKTTRFERVVFDVDDGQRYPFPDGSMAGVLCCELLEHLFYDPAWMLHEANRVLAPNGWLLLTTPNLTSYHSLRAVAQGRHPLEHSRYFHGKYPRTGIQHTREYGFWEVGQLLESSGFSVEQQTTHAFFEAERLGWREWLTLLPATMVYNLLQVRHPKHFLPKYRRPHTFVLARKSGLPRDRYPKGVYLQ